MRHLILVSDLHAGSSVSLCPAKVSMDEGGAYHASAPQLQLLKWWNEFWNEWVPSVTNGEPFAVVVNGDAVEGRHHNCIEPFTLNLATQAKVAYELLRPIRDRASAFFIVRGTEAHDGKCCETLEVLGQMLGAEKVDDNYTSWLLTMNFAGHIVNLAHHIGTTASAAYETSALNRELVSCFVEAGQWGEAIPDILIRSHRHRHSAIEIPTENGVARVVVTPAWQLATPFSHKVATNRRPQVGGVALIAEDHGELVVRRRVWVPKNEVKAKLGKETRSTGIISLHQLKKPKSSTAKRASRAASSPKKPDSPTAQ